MELAEHLAPRPRISPEGVKGDARGPAVDVIGQAGNARLASAGATAMEITRRGNMPART
jgi:hypothetical protein